MASLELLNDMHIFELQPKLEFERGSNLAWLVFFCKGQHKLLHHILQVIMPQWLEFVKKKKDLSSIASFTQSHRVMAVNYHPIWRYVDIGRSLGLGMFYGMVRYAL